MAQISNVKFFTVDPYFGVVFSTGHPKSAKNQYQFQCTTLTEGEFLLITIEMNLHLHASEYGGFEMLMITKMLLASRMSGGRPRQVFRPNSRTCGGTKCGVGRQGSPRASKTTG